MLYYDFQLYRLFLENLYENSPKVFTSEFVFEFKGDPYQGVTKPISTSLSKISVVKLFLLVSKYLILFPDLQPYEEQLNK